MLVIGVTIHIVHEYFYRLWLTHYVLGTDKQLSQFILAKKAALFSLKLQPRVYTAIEAGETF